jgi:hypothetical protein
MNAIESESYSRFWKAARVMEKNTMPAFAPLIVIGLTMFLVLSSFVVSLVLRFLENETNERCEGICAVGRGSRS